MITLGLTGSIGMGKSTVSNMFKEKNIPVIDADQIVHDLYNQAETAATIEQHFPGSTDQISGCVDRQKLSKLVVGQKEEIEKLQNLVHPLVAREKAAMLERYMQQGEKLVVVDVPLLFETKGDASMTATLVVSAGAETQRSRVLVRPNMTEQKFEQIKKLQMSDEEKRRRATYVISTDCTLEETNTEVTKLILKLTGDATQL